MPGKQYDSYGGVTARPRESLLQAVLRFVLEARNYHSTHRIALIGSLTTSKPLPKDADVLVTIEDGVDLGPLAAAGRRLQGSAQQINLGADIFLADTEGRYLGRICHYRKCHPRVQCRAQHCGQRERLNDDLGVVTLSRKTIETPAVILWPRVAANTPVAEDVKAFLLASLNSRPVAEGVLCPVRPQRVASGNARSEHVWAAKPPGADLA